MITVRTYTGIARCYVAVHDDCARPATSRIDTADDRYFVCSRHLAAWSRGQDIPRVETYEFAFALAEALT